MDAGARDVEIKSKQRDSWNTFSAGWRKWDALAMRMMKPAADAMLADISWHDGISILDVASGTGEPGLTAAASINAHAHGGSVLATDLSEQMTAIARATARTRGLSNFRAETASADQIPSADNFFDVVLCRYGFMFFPNVATTLAELKRVLKPGGQLVAAVWSAPSQNAWATTVMNEIEAHVGRSPTPPDAPGLFRFANLEGLATEFQLAGLRELRRQEIEWIASYESPRVYWDFVTEVAAPVVAGLAKADPATRLKIEAQVLSAAAGHLVDGEVRLLCGTHVLSAIK